MELVSQTLKRKLKGLAMGFEREWRGNGEFSSDACMLIYRQSLGQFGN